MPNVCVGPEFQVVLGVLDITTVMAVQLVHNVSHAAAGNGNFSTQRSLPGTNHHDWTASWTNTEDVPVLAIVEATCFHMAVESPQPNLTFIRSRLTVEVGSPAETPDITGEFDSEFGGGFDITDQNPDNNPETGRVRLDAPAFTIRKTPVEVAPGQAVHLAFRAASYTPSPWLANANNTVPTHHATVSAVSSRIWVSALGAETT